MKVCLFVFALILHVSQGERISDAISTARDVYAASGDSTTIVIAPGTYYEQLTIDVPHLRMVNGSKQPSIGLKNGGVDIADGAVRISWYCGHGYQYRSMGEQFNYGGSRMRLWNASVLVKAPYFTAENIIFENSFNQYVSKAETEDQLVDISQAHLLCGKDMSSLWTEKERPKRQMPERPLAVGSTLVQQKRFIERASAISFAAGAEHCLLRNCRVVGHQDAFYGDHGASVWVDGGVLQGGVDYIFGGLTLLVERAELVACISDQPGDKCYIAAARGAATDRVGAAYAQAAKQEAGLLTDSMLSLIPKSEMVERGMLFYCCSVRFATTDEVVLPGHLPVYLARPWRWWGETLFVGTEAAPGVLVEADRRINLGLTKGIPSPWSFEAEYADISAWHAAIGR